MAEEKHQKGFEEEITKIMDKNTTTPINVVLPEFKQLLSTKKALNKDSKTPREEKVDLSALEALINDLEKADQSQTLRAVLTRNRRQTNFIVIDELTSDAMSQPSEFWDDLKEEIDYAGFNRQKLLRSVSKLNLSNDQMTQIVATIALRGPVKASKIKLSKLGGKTFTDMGIFSGKAGASDPDKITANRLISLFPDLAAIGLKKMRAGKKIPQNPLPAWLQFPNAAALPLSQSASEWHADFAEEFSEIIKGKFNKDIYTSIAGNTIDVSDRVKEFLDLTREYDTKDLQ